MLRSCRGWKGARYQVDVSSLKASCFFCFTYNDFHVMAHMPEGQHDDANLFGNDTEAFIISELLETEIHSSLVRRWPWEALQWVNNGCPLQTTPWPQKSDVRPWKSKGGSLQGQGLQFFSGPLPSKGGKLQIKHLQERNLSQAIYAHVTLCCQL